MIVCRPTALRTMDIQVDQIIEKIYDAAFDPRE